MVVRSIHIDNSCQVMPISCRFTRMEPIQPFLFEPKYQENESTSEGECSSAGDDEMELDNTVVVRSPTRGRSEKPADNGVNVDSVVMSISRMLCVCVATNGHCWKAIWITDSGASWNTKISRFSAWNLWCYCQCGPTSSGGGPTEMSRHCM